MSGSTSTAIRARFTRNYTGFTLDVDLQLPGLGVTALFGHSGSGKTTVLRCAAGLEHAPGGMFSVNGEVWQDDQSDTFVPPHQRSLGYVFQEASLFHHLSVRANIEYGWRRVPEHHRNVSLDHVLSLLDIEHLLPRRPSSLSGGERQRVAIARALLTSPKLLLLDEPLAALDLKRKREILPYLERLHDELDIPMLFVSHSPDEVAQLADHLVLLNQGKVVAAGPLQQTLTRLDLPDLFADDVGVVLDTVVDSHDDTDKLTGLKFPGGQLLVSRRPEPVGRKLRCRIHARDVSLALDHARQSSILNIFPSVVVDTAPTEVPGHVNVRLDAHGAVLLARITARSCKRLGIGPGLPVYAQVKAVSFLD